MGFECELAYSIQETMRRCLCNVHLLETPVLQWNGEEGERRLGVEEKGERMGERSGRWKGERRGKGKEKKKRGSKKGKGMSTSRNLYVVL